VVNILILRILQPMPTMKSYDSRQLNCRHSWMMYKMTHVLAAQYHRIKRGREFFLSDFMKNISGTSICIDNFLPGTVSYEFENARTFWTKFFDTTPIFIGSCFDIDATQTFDNVVSLGEQLFRYKTIDESVQQLIHLKSMAKKSIFVCFPIQTMQYHRLKYSKVQTVDLLLQQAGLEKIDSISDAQFSNIYLWTKPKI
jgi:hypothetical protein